MFGPDYSHADVARVGPIVESLLDSGRLTDEERDAVDRCYRAAADLAAIRHSEVATKFYARSDIQTRSRTPSLSGCTTIQLPSQGLLLR